MKLYSQIPVLLEKIVPYVYVQENVSPALNHEYRPVACKRECLHMNILIWSFLWSLRYRKTRTSDLGLGRAALRVADP